MEYYSAVKKNEIMPFAATWMDLEIITLNEDRERQMSYDIAYMWNVKKNDTNELIYKNRNRPTDVENNLMIPKEKGVGEV